MRSLIKLNYFLSVRTFSRCKMFVRKAQLTNLEITIPGPGNINLSANYAPVNSSCAHPPPGQLRGICTHRLSRGSGISLPKGYPRAFDTRGFWLEIQTKTILSEKTSSLFLIGLSVKDWTKLWRFLKVCFLDFRHFLIVYQATTLKRDREKSLWLCISRSKRIPGVGHLLSSFIPTPGNLPPKTKKSANARGLARGGDGRSWNWLVH